MFDMNLYQIPLRRPPDACAVITGSPEFPNIRGNVLFYQAGAGVLVIAQINGLPEKAEACASNIFGFHIHEGTACTGNAEDPFADTGAHYNPQKCPHPAHAGDLPPLFSSRGHAFMVVFTDRFTIEEILDRTVILHAAPDDFTTQPSGNAGAKIACGQIRKTSAITPC